VASGSFRHRFKHRLFPCSLAVTQGITVVFLPLCKKKPFFFNAIFFKKKKNKKKKRISKRQQGAAVTFVAFKMDPTHKNGTTRLFLKKKPLKLTPLSAETHF
jgi:hypothetical protein